ncbi:MAG: hypothetical protein FJ087_03460 [Deltaproteobacteria bacterium]|nr:hypothetical protein [Deltaproteobacteria bacterium]
MRLLPIRLDGLEIPLGPGRYWIPPYYTLDDVERLGDLLAPGLRGVRYRVDTTWSLLATMGRKAGFGTETLLIVRMDDPVDVPEDVEGALDAVPGPGWVFVQARTAPAGRTGWLEKAVKPVVMRHLAKVAADPGHPLAGLGFAALPVPEAAALTPDPVELVELVAAAIDHRTRHADRGTAAGDWRRSLMVAAGERLAARLSRLPPEEARPALEVVLAGGAEPPDAQAFQAGCAALERIGLARCTRGHESLGPLAARATEDPVLAALEARLAPEAWTPAARGFAERHRPPAAAAAADLPALLASVASAFPGGRTDCADLLAARVGGQQPDLPVLREAADVLRALEVLPLGVDPLPEGLAASVVAVLRRLDRVRDEAPPASRPLVDLARALVRLYAVRGLDLIELQADALRDVDAAADACAAPGVPAPAGAAPAPPSWEARVRAEARARHVAGLVTRARSAADQDRAIALAREASIDELSHAVMASYIAAVFEARGDRVEALRILRGEALPVFVGPGNTRERLVCRAGIAVLLLKRGRRADRREADDLLRSALADAEALRIPEAEQIRRIRTQAGLDEA